jgi:aminobenzoyl-glutamate utilization protein B
MGIGIKGAIVAAKTLALTVAQLYQSPETISAAKAEFAKSRGPNFVYKPLVGVRKPPLDYRKNGSLADAG